MAPLSKQLSGLILPHDYYGSHLDAKGHTIDTELEIQNFQRAGNTLAEIWNNLLIDEYITVAKYIVPEESEIDVPDLSDYKWRAKHVREGHYFLQVCLKPKYDINTSFCYIERRLSNATIEAVANHFAVICGKFSLDSFRLHFLWIRMAYVTKTEQN